MTCIIGLKDKNKIILGADSRTTSGSFIYNSVSDKLLELDNILMGFGGSCRIYGVIQSMFEVPEHPKNKSDIQYLQGVFVNKIRKCLEDAKASVVEEDGTSSIGQSLLIVIYNNNLYTIENDYSIMWYEDFVSIGSGSDIALGALEATKNLNMEPEERIKMALEAACKFNAGCAPPFKIIKRLLQSDKI